MKKNLLFMLLALLAIQPIFAQVPSYVPTNGLVGYWPFNGNANDESGNGNNFTVNGPVLTSDRFGNANSAFKYLGLPQAAQYMIINQINNFKTPKFSYSIWINTQSFYPNIIPSNPFEYNNFNMQAILSMNSNNWSIGPAISSNLSLGDNSKINSGCWIPVGGYQQATSSNSLISLNTWYNITVTFNGSLFNLYLNGNLVLEMNPITVNYNNHFDIILGGERNGTNMVPMGGFNGKIDDFAWWNRALTPQEITNLYNSVNSNECLTMVINSGPLSTNPVTYTSTVNIFPNPANDQITIDCGNLANVVGWNIKITNALGQQVFAAPMNTQQYVVPLNSWSGQGMYFVKILNAQNEVVNIKKIILQ